MLVCLPCFCQIFFISCHICHPVYILYLWFFFDKMSQLALKSGSAVHIGRKRRTWYMEYCVLKTPRVLIFCEDKLHNLFPFWITRSKFARGRFFSLLCPRNLHCYLNNWNRDKNINEIRENNMVKSKDRLISLHPTGFAELSF